jgi:glycosyltransferase A (GT-A) superfamily protein (DUF2064 family)
MAARVLVLFARQPGCQARDKGLPAASGERLFAAFARGWADAATRCGARLIVATPDGDRSGWRRALPGTRFDLIEQRGSSLGSRLRFAARYAASGGGCVVLVGGDVAPSAPSLAAAFELREGSADAVLAPARDGGVSLVSLREEDLDLLGGFVPRDAALFRSLCRSLELRSRRVAIVEAAADVDGRRELRRLLRTASLANAELTLLARAVLAEVRDPESRFDLPPSASHDVDSRIPRGPPLAA